MLCGPLNDAHLTLLVQKLLAEGKPGGISDAILGQIPRGPV